MRFGISKIRMCRSSAGGGCTLLTPANVIGTSLLGWAEDRARLAIPKAPAEARVKLLVDTLDINPLAHELFRNCGFKLVRHSLRMVTSLNDSLPQPQWPADIAVRSMRLGQDERAVFCGLTRSFPGSLGTRGMAF